MNVSGARYRLLKRLAVGGMAEIFLAALVGEAGFERPVILKKILPGLAGDPDFVRRLVDEGLLAARLTHPNIVQIMDLGKLGPDYFIAMEYVEGQDLRDVLKQARARGFQIPVPIGTHLLWQVARGLAYAHEKKDNRGEPLGIVHRDVSPANVLLSWEGQVKLTDFGIAKANRRLTVTLPGVLQGKFAYMSPEQGEGDDLDCRSDIFSFGVVAYELLSLQRPFEGPSDLRTLDAIRTSQPTPLAEVRPGLPAELLDIVGRCLQKDRDQRYHSGADLERAFAMLMRTQGWVVTDADVADFLQMLYGEEAQKSAAGEELAADTWVPSTPLQPSELVNVQWGVTTPPPSDATRSVRVQDWRKWQKRRRWWGGAIAGFVVLLALAGVWLWAPWQQPPELALAEPAAAVAPQQEPSGQQSNTQPPPAQPEQAKALASVPERSAKRPPQPAPSVQPPVKLSSPAHEPGAIAPLPSDGLQRLLETAATPWRPHARSLRTVAQKIAASFDSQQAEEQPKSTLTRLFVMPEGAMVSVDGKLLGPAPQLLTLVPGQKRTVRLEAPGYTPEEFSIEYPGPRKMQKNLAIFGQGRLALRYFPANAALTIDGKAVAGQNGLNIVEMDLPVGAHVVVLRHQDRETVKTITIEKDREWRGTMTVEP